jgi:hypothetical protein
MAVSSEEVMRLMGEQKNTKEAPEAPEMGEGEGEAEEIETEESSSPMAAPMSTPEPKMGSKEGAMVNLGLAMDLIKRALPAIGVDSEEGKKVISAIKVLSDLTGKSSDGMEELKKSEILQMLQTLPQAGGATPEGKAMAAAPAVPGMMP